MGLVEYRQKRNFKKTPEPKARVRRPDKVLHYFIQKHRARRLHWDFRLEHRGVLKSWAVPKGPPARAGERRLAVQVEDHPYAYGNFSGTIPRGQYGAGTVEVWDKGVFEPLTPMDAGLKKGHITIVMLGKRLKGEYALVRLPAQAEPKDGKNWLLLKAKKKYYAHAQKV